MRHDEARLRQPEQRLAHGRPTDAEPGGEIHVFELLAGRERAVDDRVAQTPVHVVAQQAPIDRAEAVGNRHLIVIVTRP